MGYNPQNAKEQENLPPDTIIEGAIINIKDGVVKDFVKSLDKWEGDIDSKAIELEIEVMYKTISHRFRQIFTYVMEGDKTAYNTRSNLGKFKKKYSELPKVGLVVKCLTNGEGFLKLKID